MFHFEEAFKFRVANRNSRLFLDIGNAIKEKGGRFLEAPVSGSKRPAEAGEVSTSPGYYFILRGFEPIPRYCRLKFLELLMSSF